MKVRVCKYCCFNDAVFGDLCAFCHHVHAHHSDLIGVATMLSPRAHSGLRFQVKAESLPERCEVCHQKDQFDPENNHCIRCSLQSRFDDAMKEDFSEEWLLKLLKFLAVMALIIICLLLCKYSSIDL